MRWPNKKIHYTKSLNTFQNVLWTGWQSRCQSLSRVGHTVLPGVHLFFVFSYKLYTTVQPVMKSRSCSKDSVGLRALRQLRFDTQPSSDSESEPPDLGKVTDSDSNGDDQEKEKSEEVPGQPESLFL